jgi:hypothetical protein
MRIRGRGLTAASNCGAVQIENGAASVTEALEKMLKFMSGVSGPPEGEEERRRITGTLHALDHATRFAETASGEGRRSRQRKLAQKTSAQLSSVPRRYNA